MCRLSAPVTPFLSELLWHELTGTDRFKHGQPISVHMSDYPVADDSLIDTQLEGQMDLVEQIVSLGRAARSRKNLKVRQPLRRILVALPQGSKRDQVAEYFGIIKDELNIKAVEFSDELDKYVTYSAKLNFKIAGPKLGGDVKQAAALITQLESGAIRTFDKKKEMELSFGGKKVTLAAEDVDVIKNEKDGYAVESDGPVTIALDTQLDDDLIGEGFARELVNKIQNMRKSSGFEVTDHIAVRLHSSDRLRAAAGKHDEFIRRETLARSLEFTDTPVNDGTEWNINGESTAIAVKKV
jgi:isoleucyl-tRNA synthetase